MCTLLLARAPPGAVAPPTHRSTPPLGVQNDEGEKGGGEQVMPREAKSPGSFDSVTSKERKVSSKPCERSAVPNGLKARLVQLVETVYVDPDSLCLKHLPQLSRIVQCMKAGIVLGLPSGHPEQKDESWLLQARAVVCAVFLMPGRGDQTSAGRRKDVF